MDDQQFHNRADAALEDLNTALIAAGENYGFDVDFQAGALAVEFEEPPSKFVVSPNTPVRQIWVSALSRSFKLDWDEETHVFVYAETGESLNSLMANVISEHLGVPVVLV